MGKNLYSGGKKADRRRGLKKIETGRGNAMRQRGRGESRIKSIA